MQLSIITISPRQQKTSHNQQKAHIPPLPKSQKRYCMFLFVAVGSEERIWKHDAFGAFGISLAGCVPIRAISAFVQWLTAASKSDRWTRRNCPSGGCRICTLVLISRKRRARQFASFAFGMQSKNLIVTEHRMVQIHFFLNLFVGIFTKTTSAAMKKPCGGLRISAAATSTATII